MGTKFIKVIFMVDVYSKCLCIPKGRDKLYLNTFRLIEAFKQLTFLYEDSAGNQMREISQVSKEFSTRGHSI